ncbi:alpha/beta fold hydrolase [Pseudoduganella sp. UC29_106]|uniref:alpha/beta fold hydrolase n=1 Tax=Pseudoduganella sp. UC29_106 TaxID=3374553 RepID=UPI003757FABD
MFRLIASAVVVLTLSLPAAAEVRPFPSTFKARDIKTEGATIHVMVGGEGPAVVLLHGFGDTGAMWSPLAARLAAKHTVVVPDLRGMGLSSHPAEGYDKWTQAGDIRAVLAELKIDRAVVVGHDIGTMVAFAYAARYPDKNGKAGRDGCAGAGRRSLGPDRAQSLAVALQLRRAGHGTPGRGPRAHLPGPVLERIRRRSEESR